MQDVAIFSPYPVKDGRNNLWELQFSLLERGEIL